MIKETFVLEWGGKIYNFSEYDEAHHAFHLAFVNWKKGDKKLELWSVEKNEEGDEETECILDAATLLKWPSLEEEVKIYRDVLIRLHTARWTGNGDKVVEILEKIGAYSYARTNSNGYEFEEEQNEIRTLLNLEN